MTASDSPTPQAHCRYRFPRRWRVPRCASPPAPMSTPCRDAGAMQPKHKAQPALADPSQPSRRGSNRRLRAEPSHAESPCIDLSPSEPLRTAPIIGLCRAERGHMSCNTSCAYGEVLTTIHCFGRVRNEWHTRTVTAARAGKPKVSSVARPCRACSFSRASAAHP